ncbi:MAG: serine/threonine-protein kinase [Polyangiaceae bacterium]
MSDSSAAVDLTGRLLEGRYRVDERVAAGGFGVVYRGFHLALGVPIAIKLLQYPEDTTPAMRATLLTQFLAEAQLLPRLKHPNIVSAIDVGTLEIERREARTDEPQPPLAWLVMEWCGGETLKANLLERRWQKRTGRSVAEAWAIARPIIDAIAHAHAAGFVHRDIKPANVMLVAQERGAVSPRVIDFGIAKVTHPAEVAGTGATETRSKHTAFSLPYAAPEQLAGSRTGPWTDVHALALVLVELLIDAPPFGVGDVALAVIDPRRPTPASFGLDLGPWEATLAKALSLRPANRHKDAGELLAELDAGFAEACAAAEGGRSLAAGGDAGGSDAEASPGQSAPQPERTVLTVSTTTDPERRARPSASSPPPADVGAPSSGEGRRRRAPLLLVGGVALIAAVAAVAWVRARPDEREASASGAVISGSGAPSAEIVAPQTTSVPVDTAVAITVAPSTASASVGAALTQASAKPAQALASASAKVATAERPVETTRPTASARATATTTAATTTTAKASATTRSLYP